MSRRSRARIFSKMVNFINYEQILGAESVAEIQPLVTQQEDVTTIVNDLSDKTPSGAIAAFGMATAPTGWLICDGSAISRTTYSDLYSAIGTTWGTGNGSTTFNLPDLRGEFLRGFDNGRGVDSGRSFASYQSDAIRNMTGVFGAEGLSRDIGSTGASGVLYHESRAYKAYGQAAYNGSVRLGFDASRQVPTAADNRPRNIAIQYCIKY